MTMPAGLGITHEGFTTRLKWHRLRRSWADPLFSADVMAAGFALGASMELDLRVREDGGFLVLHDEELEGETTGHGLITETTSVDELTMLEGGGPVLTSESMATMLAAAHPEALLQFDMKDDLAAVGDAGVAHLQRYFGDTLPCSIIVSGASPELIVAVREKLPSLLRGIDPTDKLLEIYKADGVKAVEADPKNNKYQQELKMPVKRLKHIYQVLHRSDDIPAMERRVENVLARVNNSGER